MNCPCLQWDVIDEFYSLLEYKRFIQWIEEQVTSGKTEETEVIERPGHFASFGERWFICVGCGKKWRLAPPDPPSHGVFEPL